MRGTVVNPVITEVSLVAWRWIPCDKTCFFFFVFSFASFRVSRLFSRMKRGQDDDAAEPKKKEEASDRLMRACKAGNVEEVRQAIEDGADVDVCDRVEYDWFPLMYAVDPRRGNSVEIVQMLLDAGCDVNHQVDGNGWTALNSVVLSGGKASIVEVLFRSGANPNIANEYGDTPCHIACSENAGVVAQFWWRLEIEEPQGDDAISISPITGRCGTSSLHLRGVDSTSNVATMECVCVSFVH